MDFKIPTFFMGIGKKKLRGELYIAGDFTEAGNIKLDGRGVVRYNLQTKKLEKVVDGFNGEIQSILFLGGKVE